MTIKDLIGRSSVGEGLSWVAFGAHLRERRLTFRLRISAVSAGANVPEGRILEIEHGCPPFATDAEADAIAGAIGLDRASLRSRMPR